MTVALLAMLVFLGLTLGGVTLLVALVWHKNTRPVGLVLAGIGGVGLLGLFGASFIAWESSREFAVEASQLAQIRAVQQLEPHGGNAFLGASTTHPIAASASTMPVAQVVGRSVWTLPVVVLAGLAVVYLVMKTINSEHGGRLLQLVGAVGAVLLVGYLSLSAPRLSSESPPQARVDTTNAWSEAPRPRIDLSGRAGDAEPAVADAKIAENSSEPKEPTFNPPERSDETEPPVAEETAQDQRPEWVDAKPKRIGKVYRRVVEVGPYATSDECYRELGAKLLEAATAYAKDQGIEHDSAYMNRIGVTPALLMREVCVDEHLETYYSKASGSEMKRLFVQVEFDDPFREQLKQLDAAYRRWDVVEGLTMLGCGVLMLIGGVFGLLKLDEATRGYYTKRLFLGVPAAIMLLLMVLFLFLA